MNFLNWLVADQLDTPRMIFDKTGSLASTKRHDYLPFGEELFAGVGGRSTALGYTADAIRQKFTSYERDSESGLDFAQARYYANPQGRFTSVDQLMASASAGSPQSWNRYAYVGNNPLNATDPSGMIGSSEPIDRGFTKRHLGVYGNLFSAVSYDDSWIEMQKRAQALEIGSQIVAFLTLWSQGAAAAKPAPQNPVPPGELERIRGDVEKSIPKCADFLKALFDEAAVQTGQPYRDIMVTFDNIKFLYGTPGPGHAGEASGSFERGSATALMREFKENFVSTDRSAFIRTQTAQNFLGETIHHVGANGAYRDAALANALNTVLVRQGKDTPRRYFERTSDEISTASWYLHDRVFTACQMRY